MKDFRDLEQYFCSQYLSRAYESANRAEWVHGFCLRHLVLVSTSHASLACDLGTSHHNHTESSPARHSQRRWRLFSSHNTRTDTQCRTPHTHLSFPALPVC